MMCFSMPNLALHAFFSCSAYIETWFQCLRVRSRQNVMPLMTSRKEFYPAVMVGRCCPLDLFWCPPKLWPLAVKNSKDSLQEDIAQD